MFAGIKLRDGLFLLLDQESLAKEGPRAEMSLLGGTGLDKKETCSGSAPYIGSRAAETTMMEICGHMQRT
jgi:hypothetical protein